MGLQAKYNAYTFDTETTLVPFSRRRIYDAQGRHERTEKSCQLRTMIQGDDEDAITTAVAAMLAKMEDGHDLKLYEADGTTPTANSVLDCRITDISFPESTGPEYANRRTVTVTFTGYVEESLADDIVAFRETVRYFGGGERWIMMGGVEGWPRWERTAEHMPWEAVQSGSAEGRTAYPTPPAPLWPGNDFKGNGEPDTTRRPILYPDGRTNYEITWEYRFACFCPLVGDPNTWL